MGPGQLVPSSLRMEAGGWPLTLHTGLPVCVPAPTSLISHDNQDVSIQILSFPSLGSLSSVNLPLGSFCCGLFKRDFPHSPIPGFSEVLNYTWLTLLSFIPAPPKWTWALCSYPGGETPGLWATIPEASQRLLTCLGRGLSFSFTELGERGRDRLWGVWGRDKELEPAVMWGHVKF